MVLDWLRKNAPSLSTVLTGIGETASVLNDFGIGSPVTGMVGKVCGLGNKLLGLGGGGGGGGGGGSAYGGSGGGMAPMGAIGSQDLTSIKSGIENLENDTKEMKVSLEQQGQDIKEVKDILQVGLNEISTEMNSMRGQVDKLYDTASKSFEMLKELTYLSGIESIKSAHKVFFSKGNQDLEMRIQLFRSHQFELCRDYELHMNPQKIQRFLKLLAEDSEGDGQVSALSMFRFVMTVEAMYLQMMTVVHIHENNSDGLVEQLENFADHSKQLIKIMAGVLKLDDNIEELNHDGLTYKGMTGFGAVQVNQKANVEHMAAFASKESVNRTIFSRHGKKGHTLYHIPLLWIACESGSLDKIKMLLKLGADINMTAFDRHGVPLSCLEIAATEGHMDVISLLLEEGAQVNNGRNCLLSPSKMKRESLVKTLLDAGEDPNRPGEDGKTPLFLAMQEGHESISELLKRYGADLHNATALSKETHEGDGPPLKETNKQDPKKCDRGHSLESEEDGQGWSCDGCAGGPYMPGRSNLPKRFRCRQCDFDLCEPCYKNEKKKEEPKKTKEEPKKTLDVFDGGKHTIRAKSMTSDLKAIINKVKAIGNVDDSWLNACKAVFQTGGEVVCEYNPHGNSASNPMLRLTMPNRSVWTYPFQ